MLHSVITPRIRFRGFSISNTFLKSSPVSPGAFTVIFTENFREIAAASKACFHGDFRNAFCCVFQKLHGFFQPVLRQIQIWRLSEVPGEQFAAFALSDMSGSCYFRKRYFIFVILLNESDHISEDHHVSVSGFFFCIKLHIFVEKSPYF